MKILFHDNCLSFRGTSVALYDYAYFCKRKFGFDVGVTYNRNNKNNDPSTLSKFAKEFDFVVGYDTGKLDEVVESFCPDAFFMEKSGPYDGIISRVGLNWIHAIAPCERSQTYGDRFAMGSRWLGEISGIDYVPYMVNLPDIKYNMRAVLGIPADGIVFGRNGGYETFDIDFVKVAIADILKIRNDLYFLFQGTNKFIDHDRVIFLEASADLENKVAFINTCDALLHARQLGESFGLTCAEFSYLGKPVITWFLSKERNHIDSLGTRGIYYDNYNDIMEILKNFGPIESASLNCYEDSHPDVVMDKFKKVYL
jgi:glycosyltransferase involved in cell wall biosynthesis